MFIHFIEAKLAEAMDERVTMRVDDRVKIMRVDVEESLDIESRKNNLIFHGVHETHE